MISRAVCKIRFAPRSGFAYRMTGGIFQGANLADFSDAVALYTITNSPVDGAMASVFPTNTAAFHYLRYLSPNNGQGNIAELEFYSLGPHVSLLSGTIIGTMGSWNNSGNTDRKSTRLNSS